MLKFVLHCNVIQIWTEVYLPQKHTYNATRVSNMYCLVPNYILALHTKSTIFLHSKRCLKILSDKYSVVKTNSYLIIFKSVDSWGFELKNKQRNEE